MPDPAYESFYLQELTIAAVDQPRPVAPAPLLPVAVGLLAGIILDAFVHINLLLAGAALFLCAMCAVMVRRNTVLRIVAIILCSSAVGTALHDAHFRHLPSNHIARFLQSEPVTTTLEGRILQSPRLVKPSSLYFREAAFRPPKTRFEMLVETAHSAGETMQLTGVVQVTVREPTFDLYSGDRVRVFGRLYRPLPPDNPGAFDWALRQRRSGIHAGLSCKYTEAVEKLAPASGADWLSSLGFLRLQAKALLHDHLLEDEPQNRSLLDAMLLGRRSQIDREVYQAFRNTGTAHFLALSGMHVGMLALFVWWVGRLFNRSKRTTALIVALFVIFYALLVEPRPSVLRASIIVIVFCAGYLLRRPVSALNNLSLAALVLLVWDPLQLFLPGFQFSFVVTLGIILLLPIIERPLRAVLHIHPPTRRDPLPSRRERESVSLIGQLSAHYKPRFAYVLKGYMLLTSCLCLAAWIAGSPLAAYHFNSLFTYGWPFTALVWPFVLLTMLSGFGKLLLGLIWPSTAIVLGPVLGWFTSALIWVVQMLAGAPIVVIEVTKPSWAWLILCYASLLAIACWRARWRVFGWRVKYHLPAILCTASMLTALSSFLPRAPTGQLRVTVLSVGAGSATVIEWPDGRVMLYDAGTQAGYDVGLHTVVPALRELGARHVDLALLSHANFDHYSGLLSTSDVIAVRAVVVSPYFERFAEPGEPARELLDELTARQIPIRIMDASADKRAIDQLSQGPVQIDVLWPPNELPEDIKVNDTSLVIKLTCGGYSILLTGDIGEYAQEQLLASGADLSADVLLLPHHGSVVPNTVRFLQAVGARYLVRSSARRRTGIPDPIDSILRGSEYFNTADVGAITITLQERILCVEGWRSPDSNHARASAP